MTDICQNAKEIFIRIEESSRAPATVVIASKYATSSQLNELVSCGFNVFGENRVQELMKKAQEVKGAKWHFIGHLQTNKVKYIIGTVDLIQSVDSLRLATALDKEAKKKGVVQQILIQVNVSGEKQKFGILPKGLDLLAIEVIKLNNIRLRGLMAVMPLASTEQVRPYYRELKTVFDDLKGKFPKQDIDYLSAGMSNDWQVALEEGSNMLRIGSVIFGG